MRLPHADDELGDVSKCLAPLPIAANGRITHADRIRPKLVDVIQAVDPDANRIFNNNGISESMQQLQLQPAPCDRTASAAPSAIEVVICEQPDPVGVRYRYESEVRASNLHGAQSTDAQRTFPTIQLVGPDVASVIEFVVVVSCVTRTAPHR